MISPSKESDAALVSLIVGAQVRARRAMQNMTLQHLAELTGLKQPFLIQLERGRAAPSMLSLYRIASALDVTPGDLMPPTGAAGAHVVRAREGRQIASTERSSAFVRLVVPDAHHPFELSDYEIEESQNNQEWFDHPGAAATYVISGHLEVEIENDGRYRLDRGDALFYPPRVRSRWTAVGAVKLVHVVARPRLV